LIKKYEQEFVGLDHKIDSVNIIARDELSNFKSQIESINSNINNLAAIFYNSALQYQNILTGRERNLLLFLSRVLFETTGLGSIPEGLYNYNLGVNYKDIGEYELAISHYKKSLEIQPNLTNTQKENLNDKIATCQKLINDLENLLSRKTRKPKSAEGWLQYNNNLSRHTINQLVRRGIFKQDDEKEILKVSELDK
jgi:tetratricopeptide (TPR) repeat protein